VIDCELISDCGGCESKTNVVSNEVDERAKWKEWLGELTGERKMLLS
jgi:hypothetical protein